MKDLVTWISLKKFTELLARVRFGCRTPKRVVLQFWEFAETECTVVSSCETMRFRLLICLVWSSDGFRIAFRNLSNLVLFIYYFFPFFLGVAMCHFIIKDDFFHLLKAKWVPGTPISYAATTKPLVSFVFLSFHFFL